MSRRLKATAVRRTLVRLSAGGETNHRTFHTLHGAAALCGHRLTLDTELRSGKKLHRIKLVNYDGASTI